jgi:multiple sugar transport system permease protein
MAASRRATPAAPQARQQAPWLLRKSVQDGIARAIAVVLIVIGGTACLLPFLWMVSTSFKGQVEVYQFPPRWIPRHFLWRNYTEAFSILPFGQFFINSAVIAVTSMVGTVLSCSVVAYAFARLRAPGRDALFLVLLATMMLPGQVTIIPVYITFRYLGWINTFKPLIVPSFFAGAFSVFLLRQFLMSIPAELDDAARIDGAGVPGVFFRILAPMSKPALATVAIFSFMGDWSSFFGPLLYLNSKDKMTVPVAISFFRKTESGSGNMAYMMAVSVLALVPPVLIFFFAQRYFIQGIVVTGLKG